MVPVITIASLGFGDPARCSNQVSDWWSSGNGCIGANSELYEAWNHTGLGSGDGGIYFAASYDTNQTWSSDITVHYWDPTWIHAEYKRPKLVATGDTVHCIYWLRPEHSELTYHLYCSRSDDRGASWNIFEISITGLQFAGSIRGHDFAIGPDRAVNLVFSTAPDIYTKGRPYFCRSTNGGVTFSTPILLPCDTANVTASYPSIAVAEDGTIFAATRYYRAQDGTDIYLAVSHDNGITFDTTNLTPVLGNGGYPMLRVGTNDRLYLCYETGDDQIKFSFSTDRGTTWQAPFQIVGDNFGWAFAARGDRLLAVWNDGSSWRLHERSSGDGGLTWSGTERVWPNAPFPGDWLYLSADVRNDLAIISMHPEPGNVEAQYCSHARWLTGITGPDFAPLRTRPGLTAAPNPFSRSTLLQAPGTCTRPLTVSIFSPAGRLIRELELNRTAAWDGTDADGNRLPAGVYLCRAGNLAPARLVLGD
jgi:hypothetical protein